MGQPIAVFISARLLNKITINGRSIVETYEAINNKGHAAGYNIAGSKNMPEHFYKEVVEL